MRSKDQIAVIDLLKQDKVATARRIRKQMGWDNKHTHNIIGRLLRIGVITNTGCPHHPQYRLVQRWQTKVVPQKSAGPQPEQQSVTQICRQNWQGYEIHKIFGSARA
jgi:hypothetical protein